MFYVIHFTECGTWLVLQRSDRVRFTRPVEDTSMASDKSKTYFSNLTVMNGMKMDQGRYTCNVTTGRSQSTAVSKNVILVGQYLHIKLCYLPPLNPPPSNPWGHIALQLCIIGQSVRRWTLFYCPQSGLFQTCTLLDKEKWINPFNFLAKMLKFSEVKPLWSILKFNIVLRILESTLVDCHQIWY